MSDNIINVSVPLKIIGCNCGVPYAVPAWLIGYDCPACGARSRKRLNEQWDLARQGNNRRDKVIAGLRGALARLKAGTR